MSILKIAKMGHPVLRRKAVPVEDPSAPEIRSIIEDMHETMLDANGAGLAAPQIHLSLRIVIFSVPSSRCDVDSDAIPTTVLINPIVEPLTEERTMDFEGCLSVPDLMGVVPRYTKVRYQAVTQTGISIERVAEGFHARVVQHECDHLDGILYPQRMEDLSLLLFRDQMRYFSDNEKDNLEVLE